MNGSDRCLLKPGTTLYKSYIPVYHLRGVTDTPCPGWSAISAIGEVGELFVRGDGQAVPHVDDGDGHQQMHPAVFVEMC